MKLIPLIMSPPMAAANLRHLKTQTRRFTQSPDVDNNPDHYHSPVVSMDQKGRLIAELQGQHGVKRVACRYGNVGDVLWVRENWAVLPAWDKIRPSEIPAAVNGNPITIFYQADGPYPEHAGKGRSSLHIPADLARQYMTISEITMERVQDISFSDALAEGVGRQEFQYGGYRYFNYLHQTWLDSAVRSYQSLWVKLNGEASWKMNNWVWVIKYSHTTKPSELCLKTPIKSSISTC